MKTYIMKLLVILAFAVGLPVLAMAGNGHGAYKLDGAWVAKVQEAPGQWSYVISSDPSGRRASGHGSIDSGFNVEVICAMYGYDVDFEPSDSSSPILVNIVMTGPRTGHYYAIWYGLKKLDPPSILSAQIVMIGVVTGELEFVGPGEIHGTHNFALYEPTADGNNDGFPDEGMPTECEFVSTTVDTRLPMPE